MKKALSLLLTLSLLCTLSLPAMADGEADERLSAATLAVKERLDLDTSMYTGFDGQLSEEQLAPLWRLEWRGENTILRITAGEDGRIINYYLSDDLDSTYPSEEGSSFPEGDCATARTHAQRFLDRVLDPDLESATLYADEGTDSLGQLSYFFRGPILLHGVSSPLSFGIEVRATDNVITQFWRDDLMGSYSGQVPDPQAQVSAEQAGALLQDTLTMRLEYCLGEDGKTAALCYLPNGRDDHYVDAHSGTLVNLTEQTLALFGGDHYYDYGPATAENTAASGGGASLTEVEQAGVEKLAGVLSKEALDKQLRTMPELGLEGHTLACAYFYLETSGSEEGGDLMEEVAAQLTYGMQGEDNTLSQKFITTDARTGELLNLRCALPWDGVSEGTVDRTQAQEKAEAFLKTYYSDQFARYAYYAGDSLYRATRPNKEEFQTEHNFTYVRQENGYFFTGDKFTLSISALDGTVSFFYQQEVPGVTFESADHLVAPNAALDTWFDTFTATLGYLSVPAALDLSKPEHQRLAAAGWYCLNTLELGWQLTAEGAVLRVDAKTGQAILAPSYAQERLSYDDLEGHWAQAQIERLAQYQIGFTGGSFLPGDALLQKDMVSLILCTLGHAGYQPVVAEGHDTDALYDRAYRMGILIQAERDDLKPLTRGEAVKLLLNGNGYGHVAQLQGIYRCAYSDEAAIPAQYYGYAALAQGLGVVGSNGSPFAANRVATRAEAAVMIHNLLSR